MERHTEILNRHSKEITGLTEFRTVVDRGYKPAIIEIVKNALNDIDIENSQKLSEMSTAIGAYQLDVEERDAKIERLESEVRRSNTTIDTLLTYSPKEETKYHPTPIQEVDSILSRLEDHLHGKSGTDVTIARKILSELPMYIVDRPQVSEQEIKQYLETRIAELNKADAEFCKDRWDMKKPKMERDLYRGFSNEVTFARQELERLLKFLTAPNNKEEQPKEDTELKLK